MSDVGIGAALREAREEQGRQLADAASATSMRVAQLEAIEDDRFEIFGGDVYAKGFLRSYAIWLGVDPEPLLDRYRRYVQHDAMDPLALTARPVTGEPRSEVPAWLLRFGAALGVLVLALGLVNLVQSRTPSPAEDPTPLSAPDAATESPEPTDGTTGEPTPAPEPSPSPTFDGVELTLAFEAASWVSVTVDGQPRQEGRFEEGDVLDLQADSEVQVRLGNAGGVRGLLNGESVGPFGASGDVRDILFTAEGFEEV